ncbi:hypothetical protein V1264_018373 [Littorina saxatilis]|uniref:Major facilitator superfamily (MFS) profile domain-containing protein n=1 Tax=Littorina saxatilis TaxID=31220 RepID=A0AAN9GC13_9CAEN
MIGNDSADLVYDPRPTLRDNGTAPGPPVNSYGAIQNHSINHKHQTSPQPETKDERHSANHSRVCGWVCIEIPVFLFFLSLNNSLPVTQYYLTAREYRDLGVPNVTGCSEGGEGEGGGASLLDTIQARVSTYTMYLNFLGSLPAILPVLFMGSISHRYGRKVALYLVSLGAMARMAVFTLVFHYEWRVEYLYIGSVLEGMTGGFGCFLMSSYTIVADATKEGGSRRAVKITLTEAATMLGSSAGLTMSGYWVRSLGYVAPLLFSAGLQVFVIIFLFLFVPETVPSSPPTPISCSILLKSLKVFLKVSVYALH